MQLLKSFFTNKHNFLTCRKDQNFQYANFYNFWRLFEIFGIDIRNRNVVTKNNFVIKLTRNFMKFIWWFTFIMAISKTYFIICYREDFKALFFEFAFLLSSYVM